jgi:CBS-domain-containing membrane protein
LSKFRFNKYNIIDKKVSKNLLRYLGQCFLATLTILAVLLFLDLLTETAIIASLGASAFIVFTMPRTYSSDPRRLIGGYIVGILIGILFNQFSNLEQTKYLFFNETTSLVVFGAIAVGIAIFVMAITNTEHAPAAGIALGLVINQWTPKTILFILIAIIWMASVRKILKPYIIDLISPI